VNDTLPLVTELVTDRHRAMSPEERLLIASCLFDTARAIVESSLPDSLSREQRRLAVARRLYAGELPEGALLAHARFQGHVGSQED
jgi:hypothetical protein